MTISYITATDGHRKMIIDFLSSEIIDRQFVRRLSEREISIIERVDHILQNGIWIVAPLSDGNLAGCIGIKKLDLNQSVEASTLAVHPDYKNQKIGVGLGTIALALAAEFFDADWFYADSWQGNHEMASLLLMNGFEKHSQFEDPKRRPPGVKTVLYRKNLVRLKQRSKGSQERLVRSMWREHNAPKPCIL